MFRLHGGVYLYSKANSIMCIIFYASFILLYVQTFYRLPRINVEQANDELTSFRFFIFKDN